MGTSTIRPATSAIPFAMRHAAALRRSSARQALRAAARNLGVAGQLADHGQAFARRQAAAREAVARVAEARVVDARARPDAPPRMSRAGQMTAGLAPRDAPRVVVLPVETPRHFDC